MSSDWDLDFRSDNVVPIRSAQRVATRTGSNTMRGVPRVIVPTDPGAGLDERPLVRAPPPGVRKAVPVWDPQTEATMLVESGAFPRRLEQRRRATHADLDLQWARNDAAPERPVPVAPEAKRQRWSTWTAFALGAATTAGLLAWLYH